MTAHAAAHQPDIADGPARIAKQANIIKVRQIDSQTVDHITTAVEAAAEIAHRHKSFADVPQSCCGFQLAHVDVIRQGVTRGGVDRHQLQLVGIADSGRILGT